MVDWALITGAAGGIGQELCQQFHQAGYKVIGLDLVEDQLPDICMSRCACDLHHFCQDASYRQSILTKLQESIGDSGLKVLINNAAVQIVKPSNKLTTADWHQTLDVNLVAPFLLVQGLLSILETASGSVINIASIHANLTKPEFVCYATSKAALVGLTRSMAVDVGNRVRINAICPAAVATPMLLAGFEGQPDGAFSQLATMHPMGRIANTEEVAQLALFLASSHASFITGATLPIDGGIGGRLHDPV